MDGKLTAAFTDDAVNRVLRRFMSQRPDLFNHVAPTRGEPILDEEGNRTGEFEDVFLSCREVKLGDNPNREPRFTVRSPLKFAGFIPLPYCLQITDMEVDFHPGDQISLPKELSLNEQNFALRVESCFGLACATKKAIDELVGDGKIDTSADITAISRRNIPVLQVTQLDCFCLSLLFVGKLVVKKDEKGVENVGIEMLGLEIVDIEPEGLEALAECNIRLLLEYFVLPVIMLPFKEIVFKVLSTTIKITPSLTPGLPFNPAVEEDQLKVSIDWEVTSD